MKFKKLILPALLAVSLGASLATGLASSGRSSAKALVDYDGDPDIDCGLNITASATAAADWTISQFYINAFESADVSGGDYIAVRIKCGDTSGSWFDVFPNVGGNAWRVPLTDDSFGLKFVPAGPYGEAFVHNGHRTWDLPMNIWGGSDGYVCLPKSGLTRNYFGSAINWNDNLYAIYFMFYGTTNDKIDFDIGDIYTANIDAEGHLVKVNRLFSWAKHSGTSVCIPPEDGGNMGKLVLTRNNENLCGGVNFIRSIENVNVCNAAECTAAYNAHHEEYENLNPLSEEYLDEAIIGDYADGDTTHAGGKAHAYTALQKWEAIKKGAGITSTNYILARKEDGNPMPIILVASIVAIAAAGAFVVFNKKKTN